MRADRGAVAELDALLAADRGQGIGELEAVAGLVAGQAQAAGELLAHPRQRRLDGDAAVAVEQLPGDAVALEDLDVLGGAVELLLLAEQLQRALRALVVGEAQLGRAARAADRGCTRRSAPCATC